MSREGRDGPQRRKYGTAHPPQADHRRPAMKVSFAHRTIFCSHERKSGRVGAGDRDESVGPGWTTPSECPRLTARGSEPTSGKLKRVQLSDIAEAY